MSLRFESLVILLLLAFYSQVRLSESKCCKSGVDCRDDQCCRANMRPIGKRSISRERESCWLTAGTCRPRGGLDSACIVPFGGLPSWNDMVALDTCPCQKGLKCVPDPSGIVIVPQGLAGTCRPESETVGCNSASNCPAGECCVAPLRGKRDLSSLKSGICRPIPGEGGACHKSSLQLGGDVVVSCPCPDGLKCVPNGMIEVPQGPMGTCEPESLVVSCDSEVNCPAGECCVAPLKGKRDLSSLKAGICRPIPGEGGACHKSTLQLAGGMVVSCPCPDGLKCVPNGMIEVPQGPMGTCEPESVVVSCDSEVDCPAGECCVAPLKGKRDLSSLKAGICRPIPAEGGACHKSTLQLAEGLVVSCPCPDGLKCVPNGMIEVPQGPMGTCEPESLVVSCDSEVDCPAGECCVAPLKGKRDLSSPKAGICRPIPAEGGACHKSTLQLAEGLVVSCPCPDGLKCVPNGMIEVPQGPMGTCEPESVVVSCDSEVDCPAGECCVAPLKGKRDLSSLKAGICRPIPAEGGACHKSTLQLAEGLVVSCPCPDGLKCVPNGMIEVPQGPMGTCEPESQIVACTSPDDCPINECCVAPIRGKRDVTMAGVCQPIPTVGGGCHTTVIDVNVEGAVASCPCADGLTCVPDLGHEYPHGPTGTCEI